MEFKVDEVLRQKLLAEELKLRATQPEAWTKTKYRKYANFGRIREKEVDKGTEVKTVR